MTKPWSTGIGWVIALVGLILAILVALGAVSVPIIWLIVLAFAAILA